MTHEEFHAKALALTPAEQRLKDGSYSDMEFNHQALWGAKKDSNGYYYFTNQKMSISPARFELRPTISYSNASNNLRLLIHTRFTKIPFHYNEFIGVHYVYSGKMALRFPDGQEIILTKGQLVLLNKNVVNSFEMKEEEDIVFGIQIQNDYIKKELLYGISGNGPVADFLIKSLFGEKTDFTYMIFDFSDMPKMNYLFIDLFCEYLDPDICGKELVQDYIHIFFLLLIRASQDKMVRTHGRGIMEMLKFIEENSRNCTLDLLAREFNFNPKYISTLLKKETGNTFSHILTQAKMKSVCFLLENTDKPIREIAETCGYSNQTFFYQKFRELFHISPKEYREHLKLT